jgi:uncharacterized protein YbjT (DUF2867 family)
MKVLVLGSTGGSGRAALSFLLQKEHDVTAFARSASSVPAHPRLRVAVGDALDPEAVARAVEGQDAVVVALGIRENPFRVRMFGPAHTPLDVRSRGTRHVIAAMHRHGVRRLVVQTSYGVGDTRERLGLANRLFFQLVLKPQIADTEAQNAEVEGSELEWVIAQPVHLTDDADAPEPFVSIAGETRKMSVSRRSVGRFLADAVTGTAFVHTSVALSGA